MYPVTNKIRGNTGGKQYRLKKVITFVSVSIFSCNDEHECPRKFINDTACVSRGLRGVRYQLVMK